MTNIEQNKAPSQESLLELLDNIDLAYSTPIIKNLKDYESETIARKKKKKHTINLSYGKIIRSIG